MRVLEEAQPRAFMLENVEGLAYSGKDEGLQLLLDAIDQINQRRGTRYTATFALLNAADYGVPQVRHRLIVVGSREGKELDFPAATFGPQREMPFRTAWDAIGDVVPDPREDLRLRGKWAELVPSIPEGMNYLFHTEKGGGRRLFGWRRRY